MNNNSQNSPSFSRILFILCLSAAILAGVKEHKNQSEGKSQNFSPLYLNSPLLNPTPVDECGKPIIPVKQSYTF
jgi:hypothetical protein